jgi:hypothetical protein
MSTRIRGELFNELSAEAARNDRPLANEVELLLEQAIAAKRDGLLPRELRIIAFALTHALLWGGVHSVVKLMATELPDPRTYEYPDLAERLSRIAQMLDALQSEATIAAGEQDGTISVVRKVGKL